MRARKRLIETKAQEASGDEFEQIIAQRLKEALDDPSRIESMSLEQMEARLSSFNTSLLKQFQSNLEGFIRTAKANRIYPEHVQARLAMEPSLGIRAFSALALEVYKEYEQHLHEHNEIDFEDMINLAVHAVHTGQYVPRVRHILIDEYQDISPQRYELIDTILAANQRSKLFCVGDDWQSIMGFSGAQLNYFVHFGHYVGHHEPTYLRVNYRSSRSIVELGNKAIARNIIDGVQIHKDVQAASQQEGVVAFHPVMATYEHRLAQQVDQLIRKLKKHYHVNDILVLSRISLGVHRTIARHLQPVLDKHKVRAMTIHRSKGLEAKVVILIGVDGGVFGLPSQVNDNELLKLVRHPTQEKSDAEERRLFYVAITRAVEQLHIFFDKGAPSSFLKEVGVE